MYERILVAVDFSEASVDALAWAVETFPDAELTLFHAVEPQDAPDYLLRALPDDVDPDAEQALDVEANLEHLAGQAGVPARHLVRHGWPPREVQEAAAEADADLVILGAHTKRIWPWEEPGATAEAIVERSNRQVLVWRPPPRTGERAILAPLDLREGSEPVAEVAAELAHAFGARLVLLHVLPGTYQAYLRAVSSALKAETSLRRIEASAREEAESWIPEEIRPELGIQTVVARGRATTQILATAEQESADLIVMGRSRALQLGERTFLGSVAASVIRAANCSVLAIPI